MTDKPLFEDADEQEVRYTSSDANRQDAPPLVVPAVGVLVGGPQGMTGLEGTYAPVSGAPAVAGTVLAAETNDEETAPARAASPDDVPDTDDANRHA